MNLVDRIKQVVLTPAKAWPTIESENASAKEVLIPYVLVLAAVSAFGQFLTEWLWGVSSFGGALLGLVRAFIVAIAGSFLMGWLAKVLAPMFGGRGSFDSGYRLVAYAFTAAWLAALVSVVPLIGFIVTIVAVCWSIYTLYLGAPVVMMMGSRSKALGYTAALVVSGLIVGLLLAMVLGSSPDHHGDFDNRSDGDHTQLDLKLPGMSLSVDTDKMEAAQIELEKAAEQGMQGKSLPIETLQPFVPERVKGWARTSIKSSQGSVGIAFSSVDATYTRDEDKRLQLKVQDIGATPMLKMAAAAWASITLQQEEDGEVTNIYQQDGYSIKEQYRKNGQSAEMAILLPNGVMVELTGRNVGIEELKTVAGAIDVKGLAGLSRP